MVKMRVRREEIPVAGALFLCALVCSGIACDAYARRGKPNAYGRTFSKLHEARKRNIYRLSTDAT